MKFYTRNLAPGLIAHMKTTIETPWGAHEIRCNIIDSQRDGRPVVVWPIMNGKFHSTPARENIDSAERYIMDQFEQFKQGRL